MQASAALVLQGVKLEIDREGPILAGFIDSTSSERMGWAPAFAGMTVRFSDDLAEMTSEVVTETFAFATIVRGDIAPPARLRFLNPIPPPPAGATTSALHLKFAHVRWWPRRPLVR